VQSINSLTTPLQDTFRFLGLCSNSASVEVLGLALASSFGQIRLGALKTLIQRGGKAEMTAILERIDDCNDVELPLLASHVSLLLAPIEAGLASLDPVARQRSLCAIAKLQVASQFHHLVRVAQSPDDPQQIVAAALLFNLAFTYGFEARHKREDANDANRKTLLHDLRQSMLNFNDHKVMQIVDSWLCATHWEDQAYADLFTPVGNEPIYTVAMRQLKVSPLVQIAELLAGVLWRQSPGPEAIQALGERTDSMILTQLAELAIEFGVTPCVSKNLGQKIPIPCLEQFDFSSTTFSIAHRCALLQLLCQTDCSPDKILHGITELLSTKDPAVEQTCSTVIRSLQSLKPEIVVMVLSDWFEMPSVEPVKIPAPLQFCMTKFPLLRLLPKNKPYDPPPWKIDLRSALERLIELYPLQPKMVRNSIEYAFSTFRYVELIKHLDDWPESHLFAYGKMVTISETGFVQFIERDAVSPSIVTRMRAIHAVRFLGVCNGLTDVAIEALQDKSEKVRIKAIHAISAGYSRREAIKVLRPLIQDEDQTVQTVAQFALSRLERSSQ